jgi:hypothetical protein
MVTLPSEHFVAGTRFFPRENQLSTIVPSEKHDGFVALAETNRDRPQQQFTPFICPGNPSKNGSSAEFVG